MCLEGKTAAFEVTSKLMDSQTDLGINSPREYRIQYQKRITCSPIRQRGYLLAHNVSVNDGDGKSHNDTYYQLFYGPSQGTSAETHVNYTAYASPYGDAAGMGYQLSTAWAFANDSTSIAWRPIAPLFRDNADMSLLFLRPNAMRYSKPCDDPWFSAHWSVPNKLNLTWYEGDNYITTLGCTEQYRVCNPKTNLCSDYLGVTQLTPYLVNQTNPSSRIGLNEMQLYVADKIGYAAFYSTIFYTVNPRGAAALRASETVTDMDQADLPNNQWQIEVSSWFDRGLAAIQQKVVEHATGPNVVASGARVLQPQITFSGIDGLRAKYLCDNQIINDSSDTMSFSILGMTILFSIGGAIIIISLFLDRFVGWLQQRFLFNLHGRRAWLLDDKLQLQKTVFEKSGMGRWKDGDDFIVPVTVEKDAWPRFAPDQLFSPNTPDGPDEGFMYQRTEYTGGYGKEPGVYIHAR